MRRKSLLTLAVSLIALRAFAFCQQTTTTAVATTAATDNVPRLIPFNGTALDAAGRPIAHATGVTFALYREQQGGAPLWIEVQNVQPDAHGKYSAQLGSSKNEGLPAELFTSGDARWLGVQPEGQQELPRILLLSVPYALKAKDSDTLGGRPPSAFVLAAPVIGGSAGLTYSTASTSASGPPPPSLGVTTAGGTVNAISLFSTASDIENSAIAQTGSGATAKIGIGTTTPSVTLDVKGAETVRGTLTLPATGAATAVAGKNSQPQNLVASSFSSTSSTAVNQTFQWRAEPAANNMANPSGTLNLLYGAGAAVPTETGLMLNNKGVFTFAAGQTFPGGGGGSVTSVGLTASPADFEVLGSPVTGAGTLQLVWLAAPTSSNFGSTIVKRDASGNFAAQNVSAAAINLSGPLSISTMGGSGVSASADASGATTIFGGATASTGSGWGVEGLTNSGESGAFGVYGVATASSGSSTGNPKGVYGVASSISGMGVFGQNGSVTSIVSTDLSQGYLSGAGVWGDGGNSQLGRIPGVVGTAGDSVAAWLENDSPSGDETLAVFADNAAGPLLRLYNIPNNAGCAIDAHGNFSCTGTKSAVVPIDGGKRKVALSAIESPKNWFEDFGSGQLVHGAVVVAIDPDFSQTVNAAAEYRVFVTPNGDCQGLYVANKTAASFEVRELAGGTSSVAFDYRIVAIRKNYEGVRFADHTNDPGPRKAAERFKKGARPPEPASQKTLIPTVPFPATGIHNLQGPHPQPVAEVKP